MMEKNRLDINEDCPECGDNMYIYEADDGNAYDGDVAECCSCDYNCGYSVDEDGKGSLQN